MTRFTKPGPTQCGRTVLPASSEPAVKGNVAASPGYGRGCTFAAGSTIPDGRLSPENLFDDDEVEETKDVLWEYHDLANALFDYYAALGSSNDVTHMQLNAFTQFVNDFAFVNAKSKHCKQAHFGQLFIATDATHGRAKDEKYNRAWRGLERWLDVTARARSPDGGWREPSVQARRRSTGRNFGSAS